MYVTTHFEKLHSVKKNQIAFKTRLMHFDFFPQCMDNMADIDALEKLCIIKWG